jgi:hypothetical protein
MTVLREYKKAIEQMVQDQNPSYWVTFNFNREETKETSQRRLRDFTARLDRKLLGRNWAKKENRPLWIWIMEHEHSNLHWHGVAALEHKFHKQFEAVAGNLWKKLVVSGDLHFKPFIPDLRTGHYMTKEWMGMDRCSDFLLSTEFKA